MAKANLSFQEIIFCLQQFWQRQGCAILQPLDTEVGAGTFHPATFLRALGPEPWRAAYVQHCRRPTDGRYGENPNRLQQYYQFQVVIKPSPENFQALYLDSLRSLGLDMAKHDVRFVEDNWESPTLGAWGLGWEIWLDGMEISQFTYFQQMGSMPCQPVMGEITYGLERLALYLQDKENVYDLSWYNHISYGDIFQQNEVEMSAYNFEQTNVDNLLSQFNFSEHMSAQLLTQQLPLPAYELLLKTSHIFNLLNARQAISVTERQRYILRIRTLAKDVAESYYAKRQALGFPLCNNTP